MKIPLDESRDEEPLEEFPREEVQKISLLVVYKEKKRDALTFLLSKNWLWIVHRSQDRNFISKN